MNKMSQNTVISHYNKLEGVERILVDLYNVALKSTNQDVYDPYTANLLKCISDVKGAQRKLGWTPDDTEAK